MSARWEHFAHGADVGVRGIGTSEAEAFEQVALALTAVVTDPSGVRALEQRDIECTAPDHELLLVEWLNALIYLMATHRLLFSRFSVAIDRERLTARAWGEPLSVERHHPEVEVKGATYTMLRIERTGDAWIAQTVVDV